MTEPWQFPPRDGVTFWHVTDPHVNTPGSNAPWGLSRLNAIANDLEKNPGRFHISGRVITGDITEHGRDDQVALSLPWLQQHMNKPTDVWVYGNHDYGNRWVDWTKTQAQVEAQYGRPANTSTYVGPPGMKIRFLGIATDLYPPSQPDNDWYIPQATLDWIESELNKDTTTPTYICCHFSKAETQPEATFDDIISAHSNVVGWVCGHAHFAITNPKCVETLTFGNRTAFPHYCGPSTTLLNGATYQEAGKNPYNSLLITYIDEDRQLVHQNPHQVRYRNHGARQFVSGYGNNMVTVITPS